MLDRPGRWCRVCQLVIPIIHSGQTGLVTQAATVEFADLRERRYSPNHRPLKSVIACSRLTLWPLLPDQPCDHHAQIAGPTFDHQSQIAGNSAAT